MMTTGVPVCISDDGRWLAMLHDGGAWLQDDLAGAPQQVRALGARALALAAGAVWVATDDALERAALGALVGPMDVVAGVAVGADAALAGDPRAVVVASAAGTTLVTARGELTALSARRLGAYAVGAGRFLLVDDDVVSLLDATAPAPRAVRVHVRAPVLDAAAALSPSTCVLLLDRGDTQELAVMRGAGQFLQRTRTRRVRRVRGSVRRTDIVLATDDGRLAIYDLCGRGVVAAHRLDGAAPELAVSGDGAVVVATTRTARGPQLYDVRAAC